MRYLATATLQHLDFSKFENETKLKLEREFTNKEKAQKWLNAIYAKIIDTNYFKYNEKIFLGYKEQIFNDPFNDDYLILVLKAIED